MKTIAINNEEKFPILRIVREEKKPFIKLPREKEKKDNDDIPPHKYIMPDQPKGYMRHNELDFL